MGNIEFHDNPDPVWCNEELWKKVNLLMNRSDRPIALREIMLLMSEQWAAGYQEGKETR